MKKFKMIVLLSVLCSMLAFATIGCKKEGTMEKAGKKLDEAVDTVKKGSD
jgi:predicted small secreted protein